MISHAEASRIDKEIAQAYVRVFEADRKADACLDYVYRILRKTRRSYPYPEEIIDLAFNYIDEGILKGDKAKNSEKSIEAYQKQKEVVDSLLREYLDMENNLYEGWNRFYLVQNGHIHNSMQCGTCNKMGIATQFSWMPDLSGLTEEDAVKAHGAILCTVCFPSAPVEWTNGSTKKDDDVCPGSGSYQWAKGHPERPNAAVSPGGTCGVCGQWAGIRSRADHGIRKHRIKKEG